MQLALKRYETNINAISPPPHRFCSVQASGASINGAMKFHANFIGAASRNPAIGGLAKGYLIKEIDALGGRTKLALDVLFG